MGIQLTGGHTQLITKVDFSRIRAFHIFGAQTDIRFKIKKLQKSLDKLENLEQKEFEDVQKGSEDLTKEQIHEGIKLITECVEKWKTIEDDKMHITFEEERMETDMINALHVLALELEKKLKGAVPDGIKESIRREVLPELKNIHQKVQDHLTNVLKREKEMLRIFQLDRETMAQKYKEHLKLLYQRRQVRSQIRDEEKEEKTIEHVDKELHHLATLMQKESDVHQLNKDMAILIKELKAWAKALESINELFEHINEFVINFIYKLHHLAETEEEFIKKLVDLGFDEHIAKENYALLHKLVEHLKSDLDKEIAKENYLTDLEEKSQKKIEEIAMGLQRLAA